eukprot:COSAG02_NODE_4570_length_5209_cov_2.315656_4_plen_702_part_01
MVAPASPPELELAIDSKSGDATVAPRGELTEDADAFVLSLRACLDGLAEVAATDEPTASGKSRLERRVWLKLARADSHLIEPALSVGFDFSSAQGGVGGHVLLSLLVQTTRQLINPVAMRLAQRALAVLEAAQLDAGAADFPSRVFDTLRTVASLSPTQSDQIADAEAAVRYILATRRSNGEVGRQKLGRLSKQSWSPTDSTDSETHWSGAQQLPGPRADHTEEARTFFMRAQDRCDAALPVAEPEPEPEPEAEPEPEPETELDLSADKLTAIERWLEEDGPESTDRTDLPPVQLDFKRQIIAYLQLHAEQDFLRKHGLIGLVPSLRKRRNKAELRHAYQEWSEMQQQQQQQQQATSLPTTVPAEDLVDAEFPLADTETIKMLLRNGHEAAAHAAMERIDKAKAERVRERLAQTNVAQIVSGNRALANVPMEQVEQKRLAAKKTDIVRATAEETEQIPLAVEKLEADNVVAEKQAEEERLAAEKAEADCLAAEKAEQERLAAENKAEEERLAAEKAKQRRLAVEKKAEQERVAAEKAKQRRLAVEKKAEGERLAAEQERVAAKKQTEQERLAAEEAEQERLAAERKAEAERLAAETKAEQERLAAEKKAEEERLAAEKAEQERLAAEKKAEEERLAAEKKAELERLAAEKKAEEERLAAEKAEQERLAAERKAEEERLAVEKKAEEERLTAERKAEEERFAA